MKYVTRRSVLRLAASAAVVPLGISSARAASHATAHTVMIEWFAFVPAQLSVNVGDTVTFTNADGAPHTATDVNGAFDTGRLSRGQSATLTFNSAGAFDYFCTIHPNMKASITIN